MCVASARASSRSPRTANAARASPRRRPRAATRRCARSKTLPRRCSWGSIGRYARHTATRSSSGASAPPPSRTLSSSSARRRSSGSSWPPSNTCTVSPSDGQQQVPLVDGPQRDEPAPARGLAHGHGHRTGREARVEHGLRVLRAHGVLLRAARPPRRAGGRAPREPSGTTRADDGSRAPRGARSRRGGRRPGRGRPKTPRRDAPPLRTRAPTSAVARARVPRGDVSEQDNHGAEVPAAELPSVSCAAFCAQIRGDLVHASARKNLVGDPRFFQTRSRRLEPDERTHYDRSVE